MTKKKNEQATVPPAVEYLTQVLANVPDQQPEINEQYIADRIKAEAEWRRKHSPKPEDMTVSEAYKAIHVKDLTEEEANIQTVNINLGSLYRRLQADMDRQLKLPYDQAKKAMNEVMKAYGFTGRNYRMDQTNIPSILNNMIKWAMYDGDCEWDLHKGIYLEGDTGRGKTQLMKFFSGFTRAIDFRHSELVHVKSIMIDVSEAKHFGPLKKYLKGKWIFNDIGYEEDDRLMGNKIDLVDRLFGIRCDDNLLTHATGNVPRERIREVYNKRVDSRWDELFTSVKVTGPWDFRKSSWKEGFIH